MSILLSFAVYQTSISVACFRFHVFCSAVVNVRSRNAVSIARSQASLKIQGNVKILSCLSACIWSSAKMKKKPYSIAIMWLHSLSQALPGNAELAGVPQRCSDAIKSKVTCTITFLADTNQTGKGALYTVAGITCS